MTRLATLSLAAGATLALMGASALSLAVRVLLDERMLAEELTARRTHEGYGFTTSRDRGEW